LQVYLLHSSTLTAAGEVEAFIRMTSEDPVDHPHPRVVTFATNGKDEDDDDDEDDDEEGNGSKEHSPDRFYSKDLRGNLMREQKNRDPLFYYEVVTVLGVGSMGSVAKVRKRDQAVGGSARKHLVSHFRRERRYQKCLSIPLVGGLFRYCIDWKFGSDRDIISESVRTGEDSSILLTRSAVVEDFNDGHGGVGLDDESGHLGDNQQSKKMYAMKSIHLSRVTDQSFVEELRNEVRILRSLDHPHIVRPIETFFHRNQLFIVMELCTGGDLYARDPYTEEEAARIISSILSAIAYMHSRNICHRDLKYENILFVNNSPTAEVKLIDFGEFCVGDRLRCQLSI